MVPVAVKRAVPLLTLQDAIIGGRLAPQPTADPQRLLQIPGKHLPLLGASFVIVHVVVLSAPVLVEQQALHCHVLYHLHLQLLLQLPPVLPFVSAQCLLRPRAIEVAKLCADA